VGVDEGVVGEDGTWMIRVGGFVWGVLCLSWDMQLRGWAGRNGLHRICSWSYVSRGAG